MNNTTFTQVKGRHYLAFLFIINDFQTEFSPLKWLKIVLLPVLLHWHTTLRSDLGLHELLDKSSSLY